MSSTFLANLLLCCAAVLLAPQALECCAVHPQTVLEGLAQTAGNEHSGSLHGHAGHDRGERSADPTDNVLARTVPLYAPTGSTISLPHSHDRGEAPAQGASAVHKAGAHHAPEGADPFPRPGRPATDPIDPPTTPPPRNASSRTMLFD